MLMIEKPITTKKQALLYASLLQTTLESRYIITGEAKYLTYQQRLSNIILFFSYGVSTNDVLRELNALVTLLREKENITL